MSVLRHVDEAPFEAKGVPGIFAYGFYREVRGDSMRAAWGIVAPLGIEIRTESRSFSHSPYRKMQSEQEEQTARALLDVVFALYLDAMSACGMHDARSRFNERIVSGWGDTLTRWRFAYYGGTHCERRLDLMISDAAHDQLRDDFVSATMPLGTILFHAPGSHGWVGWRGIAQWTGELAAGLESLLGDVVYERLDGVLTRVG